LGNIRTAAGEKLQKRKSANLIPNALETIFVTTVPLDGHTGAAIAGPVAWLSEPNSETRGRVLRRKHENSHVACSEQRTTMRMKGRGAHRWLWKTANV